MSPRALGRTNLSVAPLALGTIQIGNPDLPEAQAAAVLDAALDCGINLIDTAPSYGHAEERIGRWLRGRRDRVVLSTKCGYGVLGVPDWTPECIELGIVRAMDRLRTDYIDIVHLHSCPIEVLQRPGLVDALVSAVERGQVGVAAYSGDNEALALAVSTGAFGVVQATLNLLDQNVLHGGVLAHARQQSVGMLAKRPLANAPWRAPNPPAEEPQATYWHRLRALGLNDMGGLPWDELALRFAAHAPGVAACIVGTAQPTSLKHNAELIAKGPLPKEVQRALEDAFLRSGAGWRSLI